MKDIILKTENISYTVDKKNSFSGFNSVEILKNVSFEVERGKVIGISGESGSGKSTLAKILTGVYSESLGSLNTFFKKDWKHSLPRPIQILFQNDGNLINPNRKVKDVLNEAFELKNNSKKNYSAEVIEIFDSFGLKEELLNSKGSQLSGGEQQRIALVRIMIVEPEILILDEPFSSQDVEAQLAILQLIKKVKDEFGLTIICISHDLKILKHFADEILIMFRGTIVESGTAAGIFSNPKNDYTKFLLSAQALSLSVNEIENFHTRYEQDQRNQNLEAHKIKFETAPYEVDENDLTGKSVATKVGADPETVFKTLVCIGDKTGYVVFCIPVITELNLKKAATVSGNKKVEMIKLKDLFPLTGYLRGGCSPLGMKKLFPTYIDETAQLFENIYVSAGVRGMQMKLCPEDLLKIIDAAYSDLI